MLKKIFALQLTFFSFFTGTDVTPVDDNLAVYVTMKKLTWKGTQLMRLSLNLNNIYKCKCFSYNLIHNVYSICTLCLSAMSKNLKWYSLGKSHPTISGQTFYDHHFHSKLIKFGSTSWLLVNHETHACWLSCQTSCCLLLDLLLCHNWYVSIQLCWYW